MSFLIFSSAGCLEQIFFIKLLTYCSGRPQLGREDCLSAHGLVSCTHSGLSIVDHRTLQRSGHLPLAFLRGCGLPDRLIDYLPSLPTCRTVAWVLVCTARPADREDAGRNR
jgi:hypothetical protein